MILLITLAQIGCAIVAVYFGAKVATKVGRDLRGAVFSRVGEFSEQEVTRFGAPSLITRSTNDVQQVQMLVLTTCTLLVSAPILSIGGVIMAIRQDVQLSWLIAVSVPILRIAVGLIVVRMVPLFRKMQTRIDIVGRVLREQLTGIRVVRAFVREDVEIARFAKANQDVTDVALSSGRLMALMMATFMAVMIPRSAVSADRIGEVLATASSVVPPANPINVPVGHGELELLDVGFAYPGAEQPVLRNVSFIARHGDHRQHGEWQNHPSEPVAAAVRRHKRFRSGRRRECARVEPRTALGQYRSRTAKAVPVLRHRA